MKVEIERDVSHLQKKMLQEQRRIKLRRLFRNRLSMLGAIIVLLMMIIAVAAPLIAPQDPYAITVANRLLPPSHAHWFGTDSMGEDVFSRVIYGARISMMVGFCVSVLAGVVGMLLGLYASTNKILDNILMRICDGLKSIPSMLFAICLMTILGADVPAGDPSWGSILSDGKNYIYNSWWLIVFPGIFTIVSVLGFNLFGDGLRDFFDPTKT